jgi:hypothetical protein
MPIPTTLDHPNAVFVDYCGSYWRPLSCGYTGSLLEAGVFEDFKPWRDPPSDKTIPVDVAMMEHGCTDAERAVIRERAEKAVAQYKERELRRASESPTPHATSRVK